MMVGDKTEKAALWTKFSGQFTIQVLWAVQYALESMLCVCLVSPPAFSVHEILQARILEWVAMAFSRGSSWPRNWSYLSCFAGRFFPLWTTREAWNLWFIYPLFGWRRKRVSGKTTKPIISRQRYGQPEQTYGSKKEESGAREISTVDFMKSHFRQMK